MNVIPRQTKIKRVKRKGFDEEIIKKVKNHSITGTELVAVIMYVFF